MSKTLDELKKMTVLVADTSDIHLMHKYPVRDATTNPSLVLQASKDAQYLPLLKKALAPFKNDKNHPKEDLIDTVLVAYGVEILKIVPGRVSTEIDAHLSFDTEGSIRRAKKIIALYEENGIKKERILIKLASTWEGFKAAEVLESEGIHCNMTLLFSIPQAIMASQVKATLISPFVGRILDWFKKNRQFNGTPAEDPGVQSVKTIYALLKGARSPVEIMGASFRNTGEILELAGCDLLTISPTLYDELEKMETPVERKLIAPKTQNPLPTLDESDFRFLFNEDEMAVDKLADGIRKFAADTALLEQLIQKDLL